MAEVTIRASLLFRALVSPIYQLIYDVIESINFAELHEFYEVTGNFELGFRAMG